NLHVISEDYSELSETLTGEMVENPSYRRRILGLLRTADIGIADANTKVFEVSKEELQREFAPVQLARLQATRPLDQLRRMKISLFHKGSDASLIPLDFSEQSVGTRKFFKAIGPWLKMLERGNTVFFDEIETSLHPMLVKELLKLVFS